MIAWCEGAASEKLMSRKIVFYKAIKLQKYKMHSACIVHAYTILGYVKYGCNEASV